MSRTQERIMSTDSELERKCRAPLIHSEQCRVHARTPRRRGFGCVHPLSGRVPCEI